jgi:hypothetical protein
MGLKPVGENRSWEKGRIPYGFTIDSRSFDGNRFLLKAQCSKLKAQSRFDAAGPKIESPPGVDLLTPETPNRWSFLPFLLNFRISFPASKPYFGL